MRRIIPLGLATALCIAIGHAVPVSQQSTETTTYSLGPGDSPTTSVSTTVTQAISLSTIYSDTLTQAAGWRYVQPHMTTVGRWFLQFEGAGGESGDFAKLRVVSGTDSLEYYADQVFSAYCLTDSTMVLDRVAYYNPHPDSVLTVHVVVTGG